MSHKPKLLVVEDDEGLQAQLKWAYEDFAVTVVGEVPVSISGERSRVLSGDASEIANLDELIS